MSTDWRTTLSHWLDTRNTDPLQLQRGRLLALFLLTTGAMLVILIIIDLTEFFTGVVATLRWSIIDAGLLVCPLGLFGLNRRGQVRWAAYGALALVIGVTTVLLPLDTLNNNLVMYALPIVLSSFVVSPAASLSTAIVATAAYCLINLLRESGGYFNYFGVLALFVLAVTIWMVADWLERTLQQAQTAANDLRASEECAQTLAHQQQAINAQLEAYYSDALTVHEVSQALAAALDPTAIYRLLYREIVQRLLGAAQLTVALYDAESQTIRCGYAMIDDQEIDPAQFPPLVLGIGPTSDTIRTREARIIDLAAMRAELEPQGRAVRVGNHGEDDPEPMSALYVPLIRGERVVGILSIQHYAPQAFTKRHLLLASTIASQAAVALTNAELFATLEQRVADRTAKLQAANQALRDSEERLRAVSEASPIPLVITRLSDTVILSANTPLCELFAIPREKLPELLARDFVIDRRTFRRLVLEVYRTGRVQNAEVEVVKTTGERFWVVAAIRRMTFGDEPALVIGFYDVTERKRIERELRDSEARFRQIAENIHEVFWMSDSAAGHAFYVSPAYEEIWGRTRASLYDHPGSFIQTIHPDDQAHALDFFARQQQGLLASAEYRIVRPDGAISWIWDRAFPVRDEAGRVYRIAGIAEDITRRKQAEAEQHRALQTEKELGELKSRFISMTSHEFRTPLTSILIAAELLEHYGHKWADDQKLHYLRQIQTSVKNMTNLLEEVLIISQGEARQIEFHPVSLELDRFCLDLVEEVQLSQPTHSIDYTSAVAGCRPALDEQLLRRILINLLSNAVKYSPDAASIEFEVTACGDQFMFRITDHGLGIPPEAHARLFGNFFRAGNVAGIPGFGLGLSIVKQAVDRHGGSIQYTSAISQGTTFVVTLPASPTQESAHVNENSDH